VVGKSGADGVVLSGTAFAVPVAHVADRVLIPATLDDGVVIAVVDPRADGVSMERAVTTNREVHPHLHLDGVTVPAERLLSGGDPTKGHDVLAWILNRAWTGLCAIQVGVGEAAVAQTAEYLNTREQFGRPLSTFQGTMLRAADAAIDTESIRVTMWQAAWRLDSGLDADLAVVVRGRGRAACRARHPTSPRGHRGRHLLPHPPLLPVGQADRAAARPPERPAGPAGTSAGR
jgi:alkylation response protein AidB-like acyl-CoA dehydrogenase